MSEPTIRTINSDTGEIKERRLRGTTRTWWVRRPELEPILEEDEWETTPLEMALDLVPDLVFAIEAAFADGRDLEVSWRSQPSRRQVT